MPTIKIKSADPASQGAFVIIDKALFNPEVHEPYGDQDLGAPVERVPTMAELLAAHDQLAERGRELNEREQSLIAETDRVAEQARANEAEAKRLRDEAASLQAAKDAAAAQSQVAPANATADKPAKAAKA